MRENVGHIKRFNSERWNFKVMSRNGSRYVMKYPKFTITREIREFYNKRGLIWLKRLIDEHIIKLYDYDTTNITFIYEYVPLSLREILLRRKNLPIDWSIEIIKQVAIALFHAHKLGIVHGDIKPDNIFIENRYTAKLGDWEDMFLLLEEDNHIIYTPAYASPEQISRKIDMIDATTDIYQLGVLFHELIEGNTDITFFRLTPKNLQEIIKKCTERNKSKRYQTISELMNDLNAYYDWNKEKKYPNQQKYTYITRDSIENLLEGNEKILWRAQDYFNKQNEYILTNQRVIVIDTTNNHILTQIYLRTLPHRVYIEIIAWRVPERGEFKFKYREIKLYPMKDYKPKFSHLLFSMFVNFNRGKELGAIFRSLGFSVKIAEEVDTYPTSEEDY